MAAGEGLVELDITLGSAVLVNKPVCLVISCSRVASLEDIVTDSWSTLFAQDTRKRIMTIEVYTLVIGSPQPFLYLFIRFYSKRSSGFKVGRFTVSRHSPQLAICSSVHGVQS